MKNGIDSMLRSLKILRPDIQVNVFDLYIVGGFNDPKKYSIKTTQTLMSNYVICFFFLRNNKNCDLQIKKDHFIQSSEIFNLKICLVTKLNNITKNNINFPIAYGLGFLNFFIGFLLFYSVIFYFIILFKVII
jgi:hypothetical protein